MSKIFIASAVLCSIAYVAGEFVLEHETVCLSATKESPGSFKFNLKNGNYYMMIEHRDDVDGSVGLTCRRPNTKLWWYGCQPRNPVLIDVVKKMDNDCERGSLIVPHMAFTDTDDESGADSSYFATEKKFRFYKGQTYQLWWHEDYTQETIHDNFGKACYDVYFGQ